MATTLEITGSAIRMCREQRGKLAAMESFPIPAGVSPLDALAEAPLGRALGKVRVIMHHADMLLRTMLQPPAPPERLDRIIRFELQGMTKDESDPVSVAWHLVKGLGDGDMRVLALVTKRTLLQQVSTALARHGGKLESLVHPAIGLFHAYKRQSPEHKDDAVIVDIGGKHLHLALVQDGELLFLRTQSPAMEDLVKQVAELRGIDAAEAKRMVEKVGKGAPDDLHQLIQRQAHALAGVINNNVRFAKAQLHMEKFEPKAVYLAGAGAQIHDVGAHLKEHLHGAAVRLLNPFAGVLSSIDAQQLDQNAALPSPWTASIGAALTEGIELDATTDDRERAAQFWRTDGALRVACGVLLGLFALAFVRQSFALSSSNGVIDKLQGTDGAPGLVPAAEAFNKALTEKQAEKDAAAARLAFLDGERRSGRVAVELLSAIAEQQDSENCPVMLSAYRVSRDARAVSVDIEGFAETGVKRKTDDVLRTFEQQLVRRYQPITGLKQKPMPPAKDHQAFNYIITVADEPLKVLSQSSYGAAGGKGSQIKVAAIDDDAEAVASAVLARYLNNEDEMKIQVAGTNATADFIWTRKRGMAKSK